jgi:hypothetical protein
LAMYDFIACHDEFSFRYFRERRHLAGTGVWRFSLGE